MKTRVAFLVLLVTIMGCASFEKPPIRTEVCVDIPRIDPPMPIPLVLSSPEFYVVSNENINSFNNRIQADSNGVFYAVTPAGYTILAENMQELRRYIRELQQVIIFYKTYDQNFKSFSQQSDSNKND